MLMLILKSKSLSTLFYFMSTLKCFVKIVVPQDSEGLYCKESFYLKVPEWTALGISGSTSVLI